MSNVSIIRHGSRYTLNNAEETESFERLPTAVYIVKKDMYDNFYLEKTSEFTLPPKLYGSIESDCARFLRTYADRDGTTGVLLSGSKGSGKSLTAKALSVRAAAMGIPTLLVNEPHHGDTFNELLRRIEQPALVLFDEFEKVYHDDESQQALLTVLEGVSSSHKLFVFTANEIFRLDENMLNRPGRIYYSLRFQGVSEDFIRDYCADNLKDTASIDAVVTASKLFKEFNFDSLQAIVEEMNRYGETPIQVLRYLNVTVCGRDDDASYRVALFKSDGAKVKTSKIVYATPAMDEVNIEILGKKRTIISFLPTSITRIDVRRGEIEYRQNDLRLVLTRTYVGQSFDVERLLVAELEGDAG